MVGNKQSNLIASLKMQNIVSSANILQTKKYRVGLFSIS